MIDQVTIRLAVAADVPALNELITHSARALSRGFYTPKETESAIEHVFGVDTSLVADGTYYVVEVGGALAACGGWSTRRTLYGGDQRPIGEPADRLDPARDAARIRAFFVAPEFARRGCGRLLLAHCTSAAAAAGFTSLELMSTLPGVPFYSALGFDEVEPVQDILPDGVALSFVRMTKRIDTPPHQTGTRPTRP
jgi:GNAT superfamily N-acetyltransferase